MSMTALRARCWGVIRSELCIAHLLEERREVGAETGLPRGGESIPELRWVAGHSTSHCVAKAISSMTACEVSLGMGSDSGGAATRLVAAWGRRSTIVLR